MRFQHHYHKEALFQVVDEGDYKHIMLTYPELLKVIGEVSALLSLRSFMFQMVDEGDDKYIMLTDPELLKVICEVSASLS